VFLQIIHYFVKIQSKQTMDQRYERIIKKAVCSYAKRAHVEDQARYNFRYLYESCWKVMELHVSTDGHMLYGGVNGYTRGEPYDPGYVKYRHYEFMSITKEGLLDLQHSVESESEVYIPSIHDRPRLLVRAMGLDRLSWTKEEMNIQSFKQSCRIVQTDIKSFLDKSSNKRKRSSIQIDEATSVGNYIASFL
jgi:hypothetical protein